MLNKNVSYFENLKNVRKDEICFKNQKKSFCIYLVEKLTNKYPEKYPDFEGKDKNLKNWFSVLRKHFPRKTVMKNGDYEISVIICLEHSLYGFSFFIPESSLETQKLATSQ